MYMYKQDLALYNLQWLKHKKKQNKKKQKKKQPTQPVFCFLNSTSILC